MYRKPMVSGPENQRDAPARVTDFESTTMLQGHGFSVVRVETVIGSKRAHVTWRNMPGPEEMRAVEERLVAMYVRFSHGT